MKNWLKSTIIWLGHPLLGALTLVAGYIHPIYAVLWVYLYVKYEGQEFREIRDTCALDLKDFIIGFGAALVVNFIVSQTIFRR